MFCGMCASDTHRSTDYPIVPTSHEALQEQANVLNAYQKPFNANNIGNTYNPSWQNHPNFSWRNEPSANSEFNPQMLNLLMQSQQQFMQNLQNNQQVIQSNQQAIQKLETSVEQIKCTLQGQGKGTFPAQPLLDPKGQFEVNNMFDPSFQEHVQAITLCSGKELHKNLKKDKQMAPQIQMPKLKQTRIVLMLRLLLRHKKVLTPLFLSRLPCFHKD